MNNIYRAIDIINSTVDMCFVVNLDKDTNRWSELSHHLELYNLKNIERVSGVPEKYGHLGALISHTNIHKKIVDSGLTSALILEDDVRLHLSMEENKLCKWDNIINQLDSIDNNKRSIYYLGGRQPSENTVDLVPKSSHGAYAYIMTLPGAEYSCQHHNFNIRKLQEYINKHGVQGTYNGKWKHTDKFHIDNWLTSWKSNFRLSTPLFTHYHEYMSNTKPGVTYKQLLERTGRNIKPKENF